MTVGRNTWGNPNPAGTIQRIVPAGLGFMLIQSWVSFVDGGPALHQHRANVWCLLGNQDRPIGLGPSSHTPKLTEIEADQSQFKNNKSSVSDPIQASVQAIYCRSDNFCVFKFSRISDFGDFSRNL